MKWNFQVGFVTADKLSGKAANLICQELGFQYAVDWVEFFFNSTDKSTKNHDENELKNYLSLSNLYCGESAGVFNDCSYNITKLLSVSLPVIILSCNPAPGEIFF